MSRSREVDAWFATYDNPMKEVVLRIREFVLDADAGIDECIKWQAPTFTHLGNLASFFPKSKQHASLMFHQGANIPGTHPRLEGTGDTSRVMKIGSRAGGRALVFRSAQPSRITDPRWPHNVAGRARSLQPSG